MWRQFADAEIDPAHLVTVDRDEPPARTADVIGEGVARGKFVYKRVS
jgi:hypothetical protein